MMLKRYLMGSVAPVWNGADGGAGGGAGGAGGQGGQQQGGGGGDGGQGGGGPPGGWKIPDGLPPEFAGTDANDTLSKLMGGYQALNTRAEGLRQDLSRRGTPPDSPDKYTFAPDDNLKPYFGEDASKNPVLAFAKTSAHKHGIADSQFQPFISDIYAQAIEQGVISPPYDPKVEIQNYMKHSGVDQSTAAAQMKEAETFASGLVSQLKLPEALKKEAEATMLALTDTAVGNVLLRALSGRLAESGFRIAGDTTTQNGGLFSEAELRTMDADPRVDPRNEGNPDPQKRFDPALRKRYDDSYAQVGRTKYAGKQ
jgi:hypothetical protein